MKTILTILCFLAIGQANAQGRVVINEYMPWTANTCNPTSEFIELLNFGPGPADISCYVLTEGDYAITIPPNTILQPGQFYVIAGQGLIPAGCANLDSATTVNLNWNACSNCVSAPIPTSGDGLFTDGGSASEQLVLLDAQLKVVDAVVRDITLKEPSATITLAGGPCGTRTFNLDELGVRYEMIGESAGRANSFARKVDGDCEWVKDSRQSANATNNTTGEANSVSYLLHFTRAQDCGPGQRGSIAIQVLAPDVNTAFPITYTLVRDANNNQQFELADTYLTGVDSTPPYVEFSELEAGRYRVSVGSALGCNLKTIEFDILPCGSVLPLQLLEFGHVNSMSNGHLFRFRLAHAASLKEAVLEQSADGRNYSDAGRWQPASYQRVEDQAEISIPPGWGRYFRLRLVSFEGSVIFSPTISLNTGIQAPAVQYWPNPVTHRLHITWPQMTQKLSYRVHSTTGSLVLQGTVLPAVHSGVLEIGTGGLPPGMYHLLLGETGKQPIVLRFVKR